MTEDFRKEALQGEAVHLERKVKDRARITSKGTVRIRRVIIGILPIVKITKRNRDVNSAISVCSSTLKRTLSPATSRILEVGATCPHAQ